MLLDHLDKQTNKSPYQLLILSIEGLLLYFFLLPSLFPCLKFYFTFLLVLARGCHQVVSTRQMYEDRKGYYIGQMDIPHFATLLQRWAHLLLWRCTRCSVLGPAGGGRVKNRTLYSIIISCGTRPANSNQPEIVGTTTYPRYAREGGKIKRKKMEPRNVN